MRDELILVSYDDRGDKGRIGWVTFNNPEKRNALSLAMLDDLVARIAGSPVVEREVARASNLRNKFSSLIVGAFHTAGQTRQNTKEPYPYREQLETVRGKDAKTLLAQAEEAIRSNDQARACAVIHRYGQLKLPARSVFDLLLKYAVSEDGALHAEKYYRTVSEEYAAIRSAFRWRQLVALARVTASEYGFPAPGHKQACELLGLS